MTLVQCFKINLFRHQVNEEINPPLRGTSQLFKHQPHVFHLKVCRAYLSSLLLVSFLLAPEMPARGEMGKGISLPSCQISFTMEQRTRGASRGVGARGVQGG